MPPAEPSSSLARPVARIGGGTLVSRLLGFVRDLLIARLFGASQATDAFFVAFRLPNLARRLFAEGAFAATLVPVLTRAAGQSGQLDARHETTRALLSQFSGSLSALLLLVSGLGMIAAPLLVWLLAPGFSSETQQLATELMRITLPYLLFIGLTSFAGAVLNTVERFAIPAFTPAILNISLISCALVLAPRLEQPIFALAFGVLLGGIAQLTVQLIALTRIGLLTFPTIDWNNPAWQGFLAAIGPTLIGMSVTQINLLVDSLLASFLVAGSVSWLYYAERLMDFPLGILGAALSTAILPRLSRSYAAGETQDFSATLAWALRWVVLLGLPAAAGLLVLAEPMIAALFLADQFGAEDVRQARSALMAYALGLPFFIALKVITPGFFSRSDLKTPVRIGLIAIGANLLLSLALMGPSGHAGLALGTSLAAALGVGLLLRAQLSADGMPFAPGGIRLLLRASASTVIMVGVIVAMTALAPPWTQLTTGLRLLLLGGLILAGAVAYLLALLALGLRVRDLAPDGHN